MPQIWFDPGALTVTHGPQAVPLLAKEYALLRFLYDRRGQVFSRDQLLNHVWPSQFPDERTVDDHIYRLRKKLARLPQLVIVTVRGYGYSLRLTGGEERPNPSVRDEEIRSSILLGVGNGACITAKIYLLQQEIPPTLIGRVFGVDQALTSVVMLGAPLAGGLLIKAAGAGPVFMGFGLATATLGVVGLIFARALWGSRSSHDASVHSKASHPM